MKRETFHAASEYHPFGCRCEDCDPDAPSTPLFADAASAVSAQLLFGLAAGILNTWIYDAIVGGPGLLAGFGL